MRQYKFNIDVGPDRLNLQAMEKNNKESIREYARRWSEVAAQVNPPVLEKEMINLFSNTFKAPYFEYLVRSSTQHFTDLVVIAERIEQAIGLGKIANPTEKNGFNDKDDHPHPPSSSCTRERKKKQNKEPATLTQKPSKLKATKRNKRQAFIVWQKENRKRKSKAKRQNSFLKHQNKYLQVSLKCFTATAKIKTKRTLLSRFRAKPPLRLVFFSLLFLHSNTRMQERNSLYLLRFFFLLCLSCVFLDFLFAVFFCSFFLRFSPPFPRSLEGLI